MSKYFNSCYWLTLERRPDRQARFAANNIPKLGMHPCVQVRGVDAAWMHLQNDNLHCPLTPNRGVIGNFLSHREIWMQICGEKKDALVLEDDAMLCDNFLWRLDYELGLMAPDWEFIRLSDNIEKGIWAYILRWEVAERLLYYTQRRYGPMDNQITDLWARERRLNLRHCPGLVSHDPSDTNLQAETIDPSDIGTFSQYGEDLIVKGFFGEKVGTFMEIGAIDGKKHSNCRLLALDGWKGVFIEPNPYLFTMLHQNYLSMPGIETICAAVSARAEIRTLHLNHDGLSTTHPNIFAMEHMKAYYSGYCHTPAFTPDMLAEFYGSPDFVSIDAEGLDLDILRNSKKLLENTKLLCVEADFPGTKPDPEYTANLLSILSELGFVEHARTIGNLIAKRV